MATLVSDVVSSVINELSQVPGLATQIYATPRIQQFVQNAILLEIEEMWWPQLMYYQQATVDPDTGLLSLDLQGPISSIDDYGDVAAVYRDGRNDKIPELPQSLNPFTLAGGGVVRYISADSTLPHRPFRVWPTGATDSVVVWARQRTPMPASDTDIVYLDPLLIMYDACWMYAVDDGTVPAQVNKYQVLATNRRKQMKANFSQHALQLDPRYVTDQDYMGTIGGSGGSGSPITGGIVNGDLIINGDLTITGALILSNIQNAQPDGSPPVGAKHKEVYNNGGFLCIAP